MNKIGIIVADDHPIFLNGMCRLIELKYPELEILATARDGREAVELTRTFHPDVLLMDIRMPVMDGIRATTILKSEFSDLKIIILTTFDEQDLIAKALAAGANGYLLKESTVEEVVEGIKLVYLGNTLLLSNSVRTHYIDRDGSPGKTTASHIPDDSSLPRHEPYSENLETDGYDFPELHNFTNRELDVFKLMIKNYSNEMISETLFLAPNTVRNYVSKIYELTEKENRSALILWAMKVGLIK